jgi:hypothetical protein
LLVNFRFLLPQAHTALFPLAMHLGILTDFFGVAWKHGFTTPWGRANGGAVLGAFIAELETAAEDRCTAVAGAGD